MKKTYILALTALTIGLASCKKDDPAPEILDNVVYSITCEKCTAILDVASGKKTVAVTGTLVYSETNELTTINVVTTGTDSSVSLRIDGRIEYYATKSAEAGQSITHTWTK